MTAEGRIQLALLLPVLALVLTGLFARRANLRESCNVAIGVILFGVLSSLAVEVFAGQSPTLVVYQMLPGFPIAFQAEPLGMVFALVASGLWIATTCYSIGYLRARDEPHQARFFACFALAMFATIAAALARNLFTLFVFYELLTLSTYPLVTHHGTEQARRGGRWYLGILLTTSVTLLMLALVWTWRLAGTLEFATGGILADPYTARQVSRGELAVLLGLFAFGTGKAALMPLHGWLPAAMVAPTPVSALLHAVAVVKVGVFTIMKVCVYTFGVELLHSTGISVWLTYVAGGTILCASLIALTKDNLKARLAYSTISQLAYIVLGAALANSWGVIGGGMHIVMHAFGKITLFFCAGAIYVTTHKTEISQMAGLGRAMPITMLAFLLGSLSIIGAPPLGGAWSKWYLVLGGAEAHQLPLVGVLMISSLLNVAYLLPIPIRGFYWRPDSGCLPGVREAPLFCVIPLSVTALAGLFLFLFGDQVYAVFKPLVVLSR